MAKCECCGIEIELPFKCNYCGRYFCEAHRLLESHDCQNAPIRTPLGSLQSKQSLAENARKKELEIASENASFSDQSRTEAVTHGNIHGHRFNVPIEIYSDKKCREKLDKAKTLSDAERIIRDYRNHHPNKVA